MSFDWSIEIMITYCRGSEWWSFRERWAGLGGTAGLARGPTGRAALAGGSRSACCRGWPSRTATATPPASVAPAGSACSTAPSGQSKQRATVEQQERVKNRSWLRQATGTRAGHFRGQVGVYAGLFITGTGCMRMCNHRDGLIQPQATLVSIKTRAREFTHTRHTRAVRRKHSRKNTTRAVSCPTSYSVRQSQTSSLLVDRPNDFNGELKGKPERLAPSCRI